MGFFSMDISDEELDFIKEVDRLIKLGEAVKEQQRINDTKREEQEKERIKLQEARDKIRMKEIDPKKALKFLEVLLGMKGLCVSAGISDNAPKFDKDFSLDKTLLETQYTRENLYDNLRCEIESIKIPEVKNDLKSIPCFDFDKDKCY